MNFTPIQALRAMISILRGRPTVYKSDIVSEGPSIRFTDCNFYGDVLVIGPNNVFKRCYHTGALITKSKEKMSKSRMKNESLRQ